MTECSVCHKDYDDDTARKQLCFETEAFIKAHPGCTLTDIIKRLYPKFERAFPHTAYPMCNVRRYITRHVQRLIKWGYLDVGEHPKFMVKGKPMRTYTWRHEDGKDEGAGDADQEHIAGEADAEDVRRIH